MIGTKLAHYEITAHIGSGGMGEVYQATDTKLGRPVAIKILPEKFARDPERVARLEREAKVLASLNNSNIATLHGLEESAGRHFLVMELIEGETLEQRLTGGGIPVKDALKIGQQIVAALEAAHERGIVHRDLKPANIKITPNGTVKVLDFGLAKPAREPTSNGSAITTMGLTGEGAAIGTPAYMAPEQVQGKEVDKRADVWAFGVVLYELLTGRRPFQGDSVQSTLASVLALEPDLAKVPAPMRRLLRACLHKEPRERLAHIGNWRLLLDDETTASVIPARSSKLAWGIVAFGLLLAGGFAWLVFDQTPPTRTESTRFQITAPEGTTLGIYSRISPDGRKVVFTATSTDGRTRIWVRDLESEYSRVLPGTEIGNVGYGSPFWSHDSDSIAYADGRQLKRVDASGNSPPRIITEARVPLASGTWSSRGVILCGSLDLAAVVKVADIGGTATPVTPEGGTLPFFLPDQKHFLYHLSGAPDVQGIYIGSIDLKPEEQPKERVLATSFGAVFAPSQDSANGHILFLGDDGILRAQEFDPGNLKLIGQPVPIAEKVGNTNYAGYFSASSGGTLTYRHSNSGQRQLVWLNRKGDRVGTAGEPARFGDGFRISPDGQRVAVEINENGNSDIWVLGLKNNSSTRLTFDPRVDAWPIWSPDGKFVLFRSERVSTTCPEGTWCGDGIYRVPADGSAADEVLLHSEFPKYPLDWSSDGKLLIFGEDHGGAFDLRLLSIADRKAAPWLTTKHHEWFGRISPDGRWVAYESNETGPSFEVLVRPFTGPTAEGTEPPGGKWQISRTGSRPIWRADSRELFYISGNRDLMSVKVSLGSAYFDFESPQKLFTLPAVTLFEVAENGSRILVFLPDERSTSSPITVVLNWEAMLRR